MPLTTITPTLFFICERGEETATDHELVSRRAECAHKGLLGPGQFFIKLYVLYVYIGTCITVPGELCSVHKSLLD
jgi:hypothetical protein